MNELSLFEPEEKWYTIEDLASLCGYELASLKHGENNLAAIMQKMSINLENESHLGGYHNTQKFYSENVLKALKEYQHNNSSPNAVIKKTDYIESHTEWFTLEQLSCLTGLGIDRLNQLLPELCNQLQNSFKFGGYHNTQKFYSENVLNALKMYLIKNGTSNAMKNKAAVQEGIVRSVSEITYTSTVAQIKQQIDEQYGMLSDATKEMIARDIKINMQDKALKEQQPKVEVYDAICNSETLQDLQTVALTINLKNIFKVLTSDGVLEMKMTPDKKIYYKPYAKYAEYFVLKDGNPYKDQFGKIHVRPRVFVTGKGLTWLTKKYKDA